MSEAYTRSGLMQKEAVCKPYSVTEVEFFDVKPNYFRVQNFGAGKIYCGTSKIPTERQYDFAVKADGVKMFAEPYRRSYVNIYNPTGTEITVRIVAFYAEFDPLALAFSEMEFDLSGTTIETSTEISAFKSPLPSGDNKIGTVEVENFPTQQNYTDTLTEIKNTLSELYRQDFFDHVSCFHIGPVSEETVINGSAAVIVHFLTNDGDNDLYLNFTDHDGGNVNYLTLKPGESIQDFKYWGRVTVSGTNFICRAMVSYPFA